MSLNNRTQRSGNDRVHAPQYPLTLKAIGYTLQTHRAVADAGR
jgi:hypothetical protein